MKLKLNMRSALVVTLASIVSLSGLTSAPKAHAAATDVVPIDWSAFTQSYPTDTLSTKMKSILLNANKYALTTWYNTVKNFDAQTGTYLNLGGTDESSVRSVTSEASSLAVSIKTGVYDSAVTGVSLATAKARLLKLIASVAYHHKVNQSGGWGGVWQSASWAQDAGYAGWLMWDDLSATDREYVRKMVEYEANRDLPVEYYRNAAGTVIRPGDTGAEENAWNGSLEGLASAMMKNHPNQPSWMKKYLKLTITSAARPYDLTSTSTRVFHGRTLGRWLQDGTNIENNFTVINHSIVHPDYMKFYRNNAKAALNFTLAGMDTPIAAFFNVDGLFDASSDLNFSSPPYDAPGGTIYIVGSGDLYYPQGSDWGTGRRMSYANGDEIASIYGLDSLASKSGAYWANLHAQAQLDMQNRFSDGHTYLNSSEDSLAEREEAVAELAGESVMHKWLAQQGAFHTTTSDFGLVPTPSTTNLALNKSITASSGTATNANDGDSSTYWQSSSLPGTITVNLGSTHTIGTVVMKVRPTWVTARKQKIEIKTSTDNVTYTTIAAPADYVFDPALGNKATIKFDDTSAKWVRLIVTSNDVFTTGAQIAELEVY